MSVLRRTTAVLALGVAASTLVLAGCATSAASGGTDPGGAPSTGQGGGPGGQGGGPGGMGGRTSGLIADVSGKTFQVQTGSEQVSVTYTAKTTFSERVSAELADLESGTCVLVRTSDAVDQAGGNVTATSVEAGAATGDACGMGGPGVGGPGMGGARPSGAPSGVPSGMPSGAPSGMPQDGGPSGRTGGMVSGKLTKIDGGTLTVAAERQGTAATYTVATTGDTTVTTEQKTTAKAAKVGVCLTAQGQPDSTGAVAATAITLRQATNGECSMRGGR